MFAYILIFVEGGSKHYPNFTNNSKQQSFLKELIII
jgi:hypothetical protein